MISLEQIKLLESKVESALQKIIELKDNSSQLQTENSQLQTEKSQLKTENSQMQMKNADLQAEVELLQEQYARFEQDEAKIEEGILSVLDRLSSVENTVRQSEAQSIPPQVFTEESVIQKQEVPTSDQLESVDGEHSTEEATENTPSQQTSGMLNHAEKSAQLDIF